MPRKKANNPVSSVDPATWGEPVGGVAVADAPIGDTAAAMEGTLDADKRTWAALARECVKGSPLPNEAVLQRLGFAFGIDPAFAMHEFQKDVKAIETFNLHTHWAKKNADKLAKMIDEHGTRAELRGQIEALETELKEVRKLSRTMDIREQDNSQWIAQRAKSQHPRVLGD